MEKTKLAELLKDLATDLRVEAYREHVRGKKPEPVDEFDLRELLTIVKEVIDSLQSGK